MSATPFTRRWGHDTFNTIAGRRVNIDGRLGALELSADKDWMRYRASFIYQSGDGDRHSGAARTNDTAHGFDTIVNDTHFRRQQHQLLQQ